MLRITPLHLRRQLNCQLKHIRNCCTKNGLPQLSSCRQPSSS